MKAAHSLQGITDLTNEDLQDNETLIQYLDRLLYQAYKLSVSDIHLEPGPTQYQLRFRQNGMLQKVLELPWHLASRLITRLKVMAQMDTSERRLPQDGRFQITISSQEIIDTRMSICPMLLGEKVVLRLATQAKFLLSLEDLGFTSKQMGLFLKAIQQAQGLILITGPTGSGKTSTLYSALHRLNSPEKNIVTVEDPIEIQLPGINQFHLNPKLGLDFAVALRAILRQDPDIIMVGEIRDKETADIAIQAAQTGHLVLTTLHANNAVETISRLRLMGCKTHHLINAISLIVAQRLVRRLCHCQQSTHKEPCNLCQQGFVGRTGIFECLPITDNLRSQMMKTSNCLTLMQAALNENFMSLREAGAEKVRQKETSMAELLRVL